MLTLGLVGLAMVWCFPGAYLVERLWPRTKEWDNGIVMAIAFVPAAVLALSVGALLS